MLAAVAALVLGGEDSPSVWGVTPGIAPGTDDSEDEDTAGNSEMFFAPIAVGMPGDAAIVPLLAELTTYLAAQGVRTDLFSARELTTMPKAPGRPVAIPPRTYWEKMASTLVAVVQPVRLAMATPFYVRAYRPPDYNKAVGGEPGSRHQDFSGLDIRLGSSASPMQRRVLAQRFGEVWNAKGKSVRMGFGVYNHPGHVHVHVDTGYRKRKWNDAKHYV